MVAVLIREPARDQDDHAEREHDQHHLHGRADRDHDFRQRRGDEHEPQDRDGAADEAAEGGDHQGRAGAPSARHLIAFDAGDDRRRLAGNAHQDRGGRAAIHRAVEDAGQHDDADRRIEPECQRKQQRHARERPKPGQHADHGSPQAAEEAIEQSLPGERDREPGDELVECPSSHQVPVGSCTPQQHDKEIPARRYAQARRRDCERQRNPSDQEENRNPEQPERNRGAQRLENERYRQQGRNGDHDVTVPEFHGLACAGAGASESDQSGARHENCAQRQWKEPRAGHRDAAEVEPQGLPHEEGACSSQHAGDENAAAAIAQRARARPLRSPQPSAMCLIA